MGVVVRVANHMVHPVWLRRAYGTNGCLFLDSLTSAGRQSQKERVTFEDGDSIVEGVCYWDGYTNFKWHALCFVSTARNSQHRQHEWSKEKEKVFCRIEKAIKNLLIDVLGYNNNQYYYYY